MHIDRTTLTRAALLTAALTLSSAPLEAAKLMPPPSVSTKDRFNVVLKARVGVTDDAERIRLEPLDIYSGKAPEGAIDVRLSSRSRSLYQEGDTVLAVYTRWIVPKKPVQPMIDPQGAIIVRAPFVAEVILPWNETIGALFSGELDALEPQPFGIQAIAGLSSDSAVEQRIWAGEIVMRTGVREVLGTKSIERVVEFIRSDTRDPEARHTLLVFGPHLADPEESGWWLETVRHVALNLDTQLDTTSPITSVANTAVLSLGRQGRTEDLPVLRRWLTSNALGAVQSSLAAIKRISPGLDLRAARRALAHPELAPKTRWALEEHLRLARVSHRVPRRPKAPPEPPPDDPPER